MHTQLIGQRDLPSSGLQGSLCIWPGGILFLGANFVNERHRHFTASLLFAIHGEFRIGFGPEAGWRVTRGVLVAPNTVQELDAAGCQLAILQIDPETDVYARVAGLLADAPVYELPPATVERLSSEAGALVRAPAISPVALWDLALSFLERPASPRRPFDARVAKVLDMLKGELMAAPSAARLAEAVGLSEGRLVHLFNDEVGLPLRRYVLWLRIRRAFYFRALGRSLTEAAHEAGFADSAHLSRTFRAMFGIRPSELFRNDKRVQLVVGVPGGVLDGPHADGPHAPHDTQLWTTAAAALEGRVRTSVSEDTLRWLPLSLPADDIE